MAETSEKVIRVGSRKSELALIQTKHVIAQLQKINPKKKFEIHTMSTIGDRVLNVSLPKIGEKSLFTRDLEDALRNGGVDFVVHSLKDLPTALPTGMAIGAVLEREDSRDALVLNEKHKGLAIQTLPAGSVIGTSSLRRTAQLRRLYPHLEVCDIRGNLNTRLAKLDAPNSKFSGIILAQAGLIRMGWMKRISQILEPDHILYAVGQGALAVECRANDDEILGMLQRLMCLETSCKILAERSFLKTLGGGCSAPVAVCTNLSDVLQNNNDSKVHLEITGAVWSLDGKTEIRECMKRSLHLNREDEDSEEEVSPSKRMKVDSKGGGDHNSNDKQDSPKVITDDEVPLNVPPSDDSKLPNLQYLMEVHGELFKKCPFSALHEKDKDNGNSSTSKGECPLRIPVGQDFMGKCPYVDTEQKVELSHDLEGVCPVTKMKFDKSNVNKIEDTVDNAKCPFSKVDKSINVIKANKPKAKRLSLEDCPFFQRSIKLIDYDENKPTISSEAPCLADVADELFCGLYRHKCYNQYLFAKCENLGRELAEKLIKVGALNVMQVAQQEIRENA